MEYRRIFLVVLKERHADEIFSAACLSLINLVFAGKNLHLCKYGKVCVTLSVFLFFANAQKGRKRGKI